LQLCSHHHIVSPVLQSITLSEQRASLLPSIHIQRAIVTGDDDMNRILQRAPKVS
ncbi:mCG1028725, partial [Mus musculus]